MPTTPTPDPQHDPNAEPLGEQRDAGVTTVEVLSWSAMMVVAIVAISTVLQTLGVEVIDYVRQQIGL
jgi:hypothetical protein